MSSHHMTPLEKVSRWLEAAEAVLIGAGAGLSAAAGFDYMDTASFARHYPGLVKRGFRCKAELMGHQGLPPELEWGYYLANVQEVRFSPAGQVIYQQLLTLVQDKDYFVMTTNADGLFARNGFASQRLFTPQGNYDRWQCLRPCTQETWPTEPLLERYLPRLDRATQRLPPGEYPRCPRCGGPAFLNVRGGDWFVEGPYLEGGERYKAWMKEASTKRLLVMDIGSGFNTPGWIRWPCERIVRSLPEAHLVRINLHHPEVPKDIQPRALGFALSAGEVIGPLLGLKQGGPAVVTG